MKKNMTYFSLLLLAPGYVIASENSSSTPAADAAQQSSLVTSREQYLQAKATDDTNKTTLKTNYQAYRDADKAALESGIKLAGAEKTLEVELLAARAQRRAVASEAIITQMSEQITAGYNALGQKEPASPSANFVARMLGYTQPKPQGLKQEVSAAQPTVQDVQPVATTTEPSSSSSTTVAE